VSSGRTNRHRLNRAGDRQANAALWRIVIVRLRSRHVPTVDYLNRRVTAGNSKRDAIRCLKRYLARELYNDIQTIVATTEPRSQIAA
jgi:transposase